MKKITTVLLANCIWIACFAQAVGIGTTTPHPSAQLDVTSTNKGLLFPRMTQAQRGAIPSPVAGLLIYQTDNTPGFYYFNGVAWNLVGPDKWGTFVAPDIFYAAGNVSIGSITSVAKLNVIGDQMIHGAQPLLFFRPQSGATTSQIRFQLTDGSNEFGITHFGSRLTMGRIVGTTVANDLIVASDGNIGIGTTTPNAKLHVNTNMMIGPGTPTSGYALSVNGKVISEEIRVEADVWPDYVFENKYPLISLTELENYINNNKHLPNIPSAKDVKKEGIALGDMNKRLLEKIEELTLYIIQQEKRLNNLQQQVETIQSNSKK